MDFPSSNENPSDTLVPVPGTNVLSNESISKDKWTPFAVEFFIFLIISSITFGNPFSLTSFIV